MGYYTQYFSTIFKGNLATSLKERFELRRAVNNLRRADNILYRKLPAEVEAQHKVTYSLKEEDKLIDELKKSSDNSHMLIFNLDTQEVTFLQTVGKILKELEDFSRSVGKNRELAKLEREFAAVIFKAHKDGEAKERAILKDVMLIINKGEKEDKELMQAIRLVMQKETSQTILQKFAMRMEVRNVRKYLSGLKTIPGKIRKIRVELTQKGKGAEVEKKLGRLHLIIQEIKDYCYEAFHDFFILQKRTTILTLKVLLDLDNLKIYNEKWVKAHDMPHAPALEKNRKIDEVSRTIAKKFHSIAQAFRIIIKQTQDLEKAAERDYAMAA